MKEGAEEIPGPGSTYIPSNKSMSERPSLPFPPRSGKAAIETPCALPPVPCSQPPFHICHAWQQLQLTHLLSPLLQETGGYPRQLRYEEEAPESRVCRPRRSGNRLAEADNSHCPAHIMYLGVVHATHLSGFHQTMLPKQCPWSPWLCSLWVRSFLSGL